MAGDAAIAQSQLGPPEPDRVSGAPLGPGAEGCRLARTVGRRSGAAARRPDADRACEPSAWARRRHLAHPNAGSNAECGRTRDDLRHHGRRRRPTRRRSEDLDAGPRRRHQGGGAGPRGRARAGQCGDQEGAVPRCRARPRMAAESAALLGPRLSHARSHPLSGRQPGLSGAGTRWHRAKAAAPSSIGGSGIRFFIRSRRRYRRSRSRR